MQPPSSDARIGQELNGKWTLSRLLGVGGEGSVYEAAHRNGRRAALKILAAPPILRARATKLAAHESRLANAIDHPGIVAVLDDDVAEDGSAYIVMELLDGETLEARRLRTGGRIPLAQAFPIFEQLLTVLEFAHDRGIVHRDIKPENVFVTTFGQVKVLDFGLATEGPESGTGAWFGTPGFMPPEQAAGSWAEIDRVSDLWAVAATFVTVLTGRLVHEGDTDDALVATAAREDVVLDDLEAYVPIAIADVLRRALAFDKADRWRDARSMRMALRMAVGRERVKPLSGSRPRLTSAIDCHSRTRIFQIRRSDCPGDFGAGCELVCTACKVCPARTGVPTGSADAIEPVSPSRAS
jgi:eukaryotic-like serine/threonine-protein kinase